MNILPILFLLNSSSWMYNKTLYEVTIPGTHDSCSFNITGKTLTNISKEYDILIHLAKILNISVDSTIAGWSRTQTMDLTSQMNNGIRYLDIRIDYYNNRWYVHHNFVLGSPLENMFEQISQFMLENPSEILLIELTHVFNIDADAIHLLNRTVHNYFQNFLYKGSQYNNETIGKLVETNQRLIVVSSLPLFVDDSFIISTWANTANIPEMINFNNEIMRIWQNNKYNSLLKVSWVLTPNITTFIEGFFQNKNLYNLEKGLTQVLVHWMNQFMVENIFRCPLFPNIIIIDFVNSTNFANQIIQSLDMCNN